MANMHLVTGYGGQAHVTAADAGSLNASVFGAGSYVLNRGSKFEATVISNNSIQIGDGDLMMQGRHARLNGYTTMNIENGQHGYKRHDLIVARYSVDAGTGVEEMNLTVIKGASTAGTPTDPAYIEGDILGSHDIQADMPLYRIPLDGLSVGEPEPLFTVYSSRNIVVGKAEPSTMADSLSVGDIYLYCPDLP